MIGNIAITLSFLLFAFSYGFVYPENKKLIYDYHATVKVGSEEPLVFSSKFDIFADVHVEGLGNKTFIQLKNVSYSLYTGEGFGETSEKIAMPNEAKDVTLPFLFSVEKSNESRAGIFVDHDDATWSVNIKRSIASLFHVDEKTLRNKKFAEGEVNLYEDSSFGRCMVSYTHIRSDDGHIVFIKKMDYKMCPGVIWNMESLAIQNVDDCGSSPDVLNFKSIYRSYDVVINSDGFYIDSAHTDNTMLLSYDKDDNFIFANQALLFKSMEDRTEPVVELSKMAFKSLEFEKQYKTKGLYDLTGGRRHSNLTAIKDNVRNVLLTVFDRMKNIKIDTANVAADERKNLIVLVNEIKRLDEESLFELCKELLQSEDIKDKKQFEIYAIALALAGTTQSLMTIYKLISESLIDKDLAVKVLREIPYHQKTPESSFLDKMLELAKDESKYDKAIREAAVLSLSGSIKTPFKMLYHQKVEERDYSEYVNYFIDKFESAVEYEDQFLYMCALMNLQIENVTDYLFNVTKDKKITPHLRSLAVLGILNHMKSVAISLWEIEKYILPVFTDTNDDFEVRAAALHIILNYGSEMNLFNLLWYINVEKDEHFLRMIHTALESFSESTWDCHRGKFTSIQKLHRYIPKPKFRLNVDSFVRVFDYFDKSNGLGSMIKASIYGDGFSSWFLQYTWRFRDTSFDHYSIYGHLKPNRSTPIDLKTLFTSKIETPIEIILFRNNLVWRIIRTSFMVFFSEWESGMNFPLSYHLDQTFGTELTLGSDIGVPVTLYLSKPSMLMVEAIEVATNKSISTNLRLGHWSRGEYGVKVYNPIADLWHGVQIVQTTDLNLYSERRNSFEENILSVMSLNDSPLGFKSMIHTEVFTDDGFNKVAKVLLDKKSILEDYTFWSIDDENTGLVYNFKIFDCEIQQREAPLYQIKRRFLFSDRKNSGNDVRMALFEAAFQIWDFISIFPGSGKCGVIMSVGRSENFNVTHFEISSDISGKSNSTKGREKKRILAKNDRKPVNEFQITYDEDYKKDDGNISFLFEFENLKSKFDPERSDFTLSGKFEVHSRNDEVYSNISLEKTIKIDKEITKTILISANMTGKLSNEQIDHKNREVEFYKKCSNLILGDMSMCHKKLTALRSYVFDISFDEQLGSSVKTTLSEFVDLMKDAYPGKFERISKTEEVDERNVKLLLDYPIYPENSFDLSMIDSHSGFKFKNVSLDDFMLSEFLKPYTTYDTIDFESKLYCEFTIDSIFSSKTLFGIDEKFTTLSSNWTRMTGRCRKDDCSWELSAKKIENSEKLMALRLNVDDEVVDIFIDKDVKIYNNNKLMDISEDSRYYYTKWTGLKVLKDDLAVLVHMKNVPVIVEFNGFYAKIKLSSSLEDGMCHSDMFNLF